MWTYSLAISGLVGRRNSNAGRHRISCYAVGGHRMLELRLSVNFNDQDRWLRITNAFKIILCEGRAILDLSKLILEFILAVGVAAYVAITAYLALFYDEVAPPSS